MPGEPSAAIVYQLGCPVRYIVENRVRGAETSDEGGPHASRPGRLDAAEPSLTRRLRAVTGGGHTATLPACRAIGRTARRDLPATRGAAVDQCRRNLHGSDGILASGKSAPGHGGRLAVL